MADGNAQDAVAVNIEEEPVEGRSHQTQPSHDVLQQRLNSVDLDPAWVDSIRERCREEPRKLKVSSDAGLCSIGRAPADLRKNDEQAFLPKTVLIGPFNHDVLDKEDQILHKWRYLNDILSRRDEGCLIEYLAVLKQLESKTRECYTDTINYDSNSFVEMMLLDGCFIIQLFSKKRGEYKDDPLLESEWTKQSIARDLILFENQIPFFVLQRLFDMMNIGGPSLAERALCFLRNSLHISCSYDPQFSPQHLLHLLHHSCFPHTTEARKTKVYKGSIPATSELMRAGIRFKEKRDAQWPFDINFRNGVIEIPPAVIDDQLFCSLIYNFVAFEQSCSQCSGYIMMYIHLMKFLAGAPEDVEILATKGIIHNNLGSNEDVVDFFKGLGYQVILSDENYPLADVCYGIRRYYDDIFRRLRATLVRIYQNNPWAVISVVVAILLQVLTVLQPLYMPSGNS